jgi:hypothetical protein
MELMRIGAPIVKGEAVLQITFTQSHGQVFNYALSNLMGAAKCVEGLVRDMESMGPRAALCSVDHAGDPMSDLSGWDFTRSKVTDQGATRALLDVSEGGTLLQEVMDILQTLLVV